VLYCTVLSSGEFNNMLSQSHVPHCRVLPPGKFNNMSCQSHGPHDRVLPPGEFNVMSSQSKQSKATMCKPNGRWHVSLTLYAHLNLQTKNKQSHVSYCRLQKFHLPFENRSSLNIDVSLKCGLGFVQNIENMLPLDRWHTSSYSSSIVSMVFFCFILLLHVTFPVHCATY